MNGRDSESRVSFPSVHYKNSDHGLSADGNDANKLTNSKPASLEPSDTRTYFEDGTFTNKACIIFIFQGQLGRRICLPKLYPFSPPRYAHLASVT